MHKQRGLSQISVQMATGIEQALLSKFETGVRIPPTETLIVLAEYYGVSIDYILKPVDEKRLSDAIQKYETMIGNGYVKSPDYLDMLLDTLQNKEKRYRTRFLISGIDRFWTLRVDEIAYFYSENKVTFAVTKSGQEHIIDLSLNKLTEQLDPNRFFRANRQVIVCIDAIDHAEPYFNGKIVVTVRPPYKTKVTISEEKLSAFKLWLNF